MFPWLVSPVTGYLVGAIPFGFLLGRLKGVDVRQRGSGRTGATNVYRILGYRLGLVVFGLDLAKGAGVVLLAQYLFHSYWVAMLAALAAIVGHSWPVYLRFRGGRGVLTFFGGLLVLAWPVALVGGFLALGIIALFGYASLGSLLGVILTALIALILMLLGLRPEVVFYYALLGGLLIIFQHRDNIRRLLSGQERKLSF